MTEGIPSPFRQTESVKGKAKDASDDNHGDQN